MSRKTVILKQKVGQFIRKNAKAPTAPDILPFSTSKSEGRKKVYGHADTKDEDGKPQKAGKLYPGIASGKVGTLPIDSEKAQRLSRLMK